MEENINRIPMLGDRAPLFVADSTVGPLKLSDYMGNWLILFSYPGDFNSVCTTEVVSFSKYNDEFEKRNCSLLGVSMDSNASHFAWMKDIEDNTGTMVPFPLISDSNRNISNMYGMLMNQMDSEQVIRAVYLIDPNQNIRAILLYPTTNGRNISEILRLLDSLQMTDKDGIETPANWMPGLSTITPSPRNYVDLMKFERNAHRKNCMDWYLNFNEDNNELDKNMRRW